MHKSYTLSDGKIKNLSDSQILRARRSIVWVRCINPSKKEIHWLSKITCAPEEEFSETIEEEERPKEPEPHLRFAEETKRDASDLAGKKATTEVPAETTPGTDQEARRYAYRERGKREREAGKTRKLDEIEELQAVGEQMSARAMPEADVIRADRLDRLNLFFARITPWLALLCVAYDYLSRFNRTTGYLAPLPVACRLVDSLFPKTHVVRVPASQTGHLRRHLEDVVRKGETFLYFGDADPWDEPQLHRLWISHYRIGHHRFWPLAKLSYDSPETMADSTFILDGAWFGRYCFVVTDAALARDLVEAMTAYLQSRRVPRAAAWRTVHVVWAFDEPLPDDVLAELASLCRETNFKLVVALPEAPGEEPAPPFEERIDLAMETPA